MRYTLILRAAILIKFLKHFLFAFTWVFKTLKKYLGLKLISVFITQPTLLYKSYKFVRIFAGILTTAFGTVLIAPFNYLGIGELFEGLITSLGLKKVAPTQVEQIIDTVTTVKTKVEEKIIDSDIPVISESLRKKYKKTIFEEAYDNSGKIAMYLGFMVASSIVIYYFGPDIYNIIKHLKPWAGGDDDSGTGGGPEGGAPERPATRITIGKEAMEIIAGNDSDSSGSGSGSGSGSSSDSSEGTVKSFKPKGPKSPVEVENAQAVTAFGGNAPDDDKIKNPHYYDGSKEAKAHSKYFKNPSQTGLIQSSIDLIRSQEEYMKLNGKERLELTEKIESEFKDVEDMDCIYSAMKNLGLKDNEGNHITDKIISREEWKNLSLYEKAQLTARFYKKLRDKTETKKRDSLRDFKRSSSATQWDDED